MKLLIVVGMMDDFRFTSELDDENRIRVAAEVAQNIPAHVAVDVSLHIARPQYKGKNTGAFQYYMEHGIDMPDILPFNRDALYSDDI